MQCPYPANGSAESPRRNSECLDGTSADYLSQQLAHCQSYSLFSPYRQCQQPMYVPDIVGLQNIGYQNEYFPEQNFPYSPYSPDEAYDHIQAGSEGRKKKGNLVDFMTKYKTEVR